MHRRQPVAGITSKEIVDELKQHSKTNLHNELTLLEMKLSAATIASNMNSEKLSEQQQKKMEADRIGQDLSKSVVELHQTNIKELQKNQEKINDEINTLKDEIKKTKEKIEPLAKAATEYYSLVQNIDELKACLTDGKKPVEKSIPELYEEIRQQIQDIKKQEKTMDKAISSIATAGPVYNAMIVHFKKCWEHDVPVIYNDNTTNSKLKSTFNTVIDREFKEFTRLSSLPNDQLNPENTKRIGELVKLYNQYHADITNGTYNVYWAGNAETTSFSAAFTDVYNNAVSKLVSYEQQIQAAQQHEIQVTHATQAVMSMQNNAETARAAMIDLHLNPPEPGDAKKEKRMSMVDWAKSRRGGFSIPSTLPDRTPTATAAQTSTEQQATQSVSEDKKPTASTPPTSTTDETEHVTTRPGK